MKIWKGFGSEHSANMVLIGHFKDVQSATETKKLIEEFQEVVEASRDAGEFDVGQPPEYYPEKVLHFVSEHNFHPTPKDLEDVLYDYTMDQSECDIKIHTEEQAFQFFINAMIRKGAKIEVFSAHDYNCEFTRL